MDEYDFTCICGDTGIGYMWCSLTRGKVEVPCWHCLTKLELETE